MPTLDGNVFGSSLQSATDRIARFARRITKKKTLRQRISDTSEVTLTLEGRPGVINAWTLRGTKAQLNAKVFEEVKDDQGKEFLPIIGEELRRATLGINSLIRAKGRYPYGIARQRGPNGQKWPPLSDATLRIRKAKAKTGWTDVNTGERRSLNSARGRSFALRETSQHLYNGLKVLRVTSTSVGLGYRGSVRGSGIELDRLATMMDRGFTVKGKKGTIQVPARPFIGIQRRFKVNAAQLYRQYYLAKLNGVRLRGLRKKFVV